MLPLLSSSFWLRSSTFIEENGNWARGVEVEGWWEGSAFVAVCLFVLHRMCWCASVCVLAGWTSALCPLVCAVTQ